MSIQYRNLSLIAYIETHVWPLLLRWRTIPGTHRQPTYCSKNDSLSKLCEKFSFSVKIVLSCIAQDNGFKKRMLTEVKFGKRCLQTHFLTAVAKAAG